MTSLTASTRRRARRSRRPGSVLQTLGQRAIAIVERSVDGGDKQRRRCLVRAGELLGFGGRERAPRPLRGIRRERGGASRKLPRPRRRRERAHDRPSARARRQRPHRAPAWHGRDATRCDRDSSRRRWPRQARGAPATVVGRGGAVRGRADKRVRELDAAAHVEQAGVDRGAGHGQVEAEDRGGSVQQQRIAQGLGGGGDTSSCVSLGSRRRRVTKLCSTLLTTGGDRGSRTRLRHRRRSRCVAARGARAGCRGSR